MKPSIQCVKCKEVISESCKFCPECGQRQPVKKIQTFAVDGRSLYTPKNIKRVYAIRTTEFREPRKGEYYLSGAPGYEIAYKAPNDLSTRFRIMEVIEEPK